MTPMKKMEEIYVLNQTFPGMCRGLSLPVPSAPPTSQCCPTAFYVHTHHRHTKLQMKARSGSAKKQRRHSQTII